MRIADLLAQEFPRRPSAWYLRAEALRVNDRDLEAARALSSLAKRTPPDDPVGMGARVGLAAIFTNLGEKPKACAMMEKIFARAAGGPKLAEGNRCISDACCMGAAGAGLRAKLVLEMGRASAGNGACR
ncbi:MAG: hypothetical protein CM15mP55_3660 [Hyphomicrobiales bacterium]|nr:MAG: hypothetical protein CM15mP55_3660 [Hyphomicrobiales bacterium]